MKEIDPKHGRWNTSTYRSWSGMKQRCDNPKSHAYNLYGGRGITYCDKWEIFTGFLADMGERPEGKSLDRIDSNGDYTPDNCRWATQKEQTRNMSRNVVIEYEGKEMTVAELAEYAGINYYTMWGRLFKFGWSIEDAVNTPILKKNETIRNYKLNKQP